MMAQLAALGKRVRTGTPSARLRNPLRVLAAPPQILRPLRRNLTLRLASQMHPPPRASTECWISLAFKDFKVAVRANFAHLCGNLVKERMLGIIVV